MWKIRFNGEDWKAPEHWDLVGPPARWPNRIFKLESHDNKLVRVVHALHIEHGPDVLTANRVQFLFEPHHEVYDVVVGRRDSVEYEQHFFYDCETFEPTQWLYLLFNRADSKAELPQPLTAHTCLFSPLSHEMVDAIDPRFSVETEYHMNCAFVAIADRATGAPMFSLSIACPRRGAGVETALRDATGAPVGDGVGYPGYRAIMNRYGLLAPGALKPKTVSRSRNFD